VKDKNILPAQAARKLYSEGQANRWVLSKTDLALFLEREQSPKPQVFSWADLEGECLWPFTPDQARRWSTMVQDQELEQFRCRKIPRHFSLNELAQQFISHCGKIPFYHGLKPNLIVEGQIQLRTFLS